MTEMGHRLAERKTLVGAARADACRFPVREDPGIEIGGVTSVVIDVAARRRIGVGGSPVLDDLVIGEDEIGAVRAGDVILAELGKCAIGADGKAGAV